MSRNETRRGAARDAILQSVQDVIAEHGLDAVTHRSIAEISGVSPGTVTYHFATRESLIDSALENYVAEYQASLNDAVSAQPITGRAALLDFLAQTTALRPDGLSLACIECEMALLAHRTGRLSSALLAWQRAMEPILSSVLEGLGVSRPVETARLMIAICRGTELEVMARRTPVDLAAFRARLESVLPVEPGAL